MLMKHLNLQKMGSTAEQEWKKQVKFPPWFPALRVRRSSYQQHLCCRGRKPSFWRRLRSNCQCACVTKECVGAVSTFGGGTGQVDDHVDLPLRFQVDLQRPTGTYEQGASICTNTRISARRGRYYPPHTHTHTSITNLFFSTTQIPQ